MRVSVITVSYNSVLTIKETFESVLAQHYDDYEYIVVDGMSTDGTVGVIEEYSIKFSGRMKWISERDSGIYDAMNKGIEMSEGDIISILNSDDLYCDVEVIPNVISTMEDQKLDALYSDVYYFSSEKNRITRKWFGKKGSILFGWIPCHPGVFVRRDVYSLIGKFKANYRIAADYDFLLRLFLNEQIKQGYYPYCTVKMRMGGTAMKSIRNVIQGNKEVVHALRENGVQFPIFAFLGRHIRKPLQFLNSMKEE